jgi:hypothetical protein
MKAYLPSAAVIAVVALVPAGSTAAFAVFGGSGGFGGFAGLDCTAAVVVRDLSLFGTPGIATLQANLEYPSATTELRGSGIDADCEAGALVAQVGAISSVFDDDRGKALVRFEGARAIPEIQFVVTVCRFKSSEDLEIADFSIGSVTASYPDGSNAGSINVEIGDVTCVDAVTTTTTSTTTSTTSTTTTTRPTGPRACSDFDGSGAVTASDCLGVLKTALDLDVCLPLCVCDPNDDGKILASDALMCLRAATSQEVDMLCNCG